jgi:zinc transporter
LHLDLLDPDIGAWLRSNTDLHELAIEALMSEETRPRATPLDDGLLLSLRGVNLNPGSDPEDMVAVRIWADSHRIISSRRRQLVATRELVAQLDSGRGPKDSTELLVEWIDLIVWRMSNTVDEFEDAVLQLEERVLSESPAGLRGELAQLRKQTISLRRYLAPQREALARLVVEKVGWLDDDNRMRLRETSDRLIRHIEDIDEVRERAAVAQEELLSRVSEQMNERMYVLSMVAAIFLPLGFFTGLMGINVGGMPGVESNLGFWSVVGICLLVVVLLAVYFRRKRWL